MSAEVLPPYASLWASTALWLLVSLGASLDAYLEMRATGSEHEQAKREGNGKRLVAYYDRLTARAFFAAFATSTLVGALAFAVLLAQFVFGLLPPPKTDNSLATSLLRLLLDLMIALFWRAKRGQRTLRKRLAERRESEERSRMEGKQDEDLKLSREIRGEQERLKEKLDEGEEG